jgi:riboflavin kinase/FMN adenylyltransferase
LRELTSDNKPIALALGYFDCVHFAHRRIIQEACFYALSNGISSAVFTFSNDLQTKGELPVYPYKERKRLLSSLSIDYIIPFHFDEEFKKTDKKDFLDILFRKFNIKFIVCGSDYRFGSNGSGDVDFLKQFASEKNVNVQVFEPIMVNGEVVSTTSIKQALQNGNIDKANKLLCNPFFFEGKVTRGKGRGQGMGCPTANLKPTNRFMPRFGVYSSRTFLDGKIFDSVTSVGNKPTFDDDSVTVETYIADDGIYNIYNKTIRVEIIEFLRELRKFPSVAELKKQLKKDIKIK